MKKAPAVREAPITRNMQMGVPDDLAARLDRLAERFDVLDVQSRMILEAVQGHSAHFERIEARLDVHEDLLREILAAVTKRR